MKDVLKAAGLGNHIKAEEQMDLEHSIFILLMVCRLQ